MTAKTKVDEMISLIAIVVLLCMTGCSIPLNNGAKCKAYVAKKVVVKCDLSRMRL